MRKLAEQGDHVTADQFKAGLAEVRTELRTETAGIRTEIAASRHAALDADRRPANRAADRNRRCPHRDRRP